MHTFDIRKCRIALQSQAQVVPCLTCVRYDYQQNPRTDLQTRWH
jgi:hypothetical protein